MVLFQHSSPPTKVRSLFSATSTVSSTRMQSMKHSKFPTKLLPLKPRASPHIETGVRLCYRILISHRSRQSRAFPIQSWNNGAKNCVSNHQQMLKNSIGSVDCSG